MAIITLLGIFGASIAGLIVSVNYGKTAHQYACTVVASSNNLLYGLPDNDWIGVYGVSSQLNTLL